MDNLTQIEYSGSSMSPLFADGDVLFTSKVPFEELRKRDVIFFKIPHSQGGKGVHRIIRIDRQKKHVKTKGDGALIPDPFHLREEDILGKIVSFKHGGKIVTLTKSDLFFSYIYSKMAHPYRKIKNIIKHQTIFRD